MKNLIKIILLGLVLTLSSCSLDPIQDPNNPTSGSLLNGASSADLQLLLSGLESVMRNDMQFYYWTTSIVGREYYDLNNTDPRYTGELLGKNGAPLDNNGFLTTRAFAQVYRVARNANNFITAVQNSATDFTPGELNSLMAVAETYKAYSLLLELNRQYDGGIRLDVADPDNLGPFLSYSESLSGLRTLLDDAASTLSGASSFPLQLQSDQFVGIGGATPAAFLQFNKAIAARVAMYQGDKPAMLNYLNASFMDELGDLDNGMYHIFGTSGNDVSNSLFVAANSNYMAHPSFEADAEMNDSRVDEKTVSTTAITADDLTGDRRVALYTSQTDPVPLIRNEELLLMAAEANIGTNNPEAARLLDIVRNAAMLGNTGASTDAQLEDELLVQRRYSLFGEGHRWVDVRRYNRIMELPIDRAGDLRHERFPKPLLEN